MACIRDATDEYIARGNTCQGFPTNQGYFSGSDSKKGLFEGHGAHPGVFCKGHQSHTKKNAYQEVPAQMPENLYLFKCNIDSDGNYFFDKEAPKLQGFYSPLFYQSISSRQTNPTVPATPMPTIPVERDLSYMTGPNQNDTIFEGLFPEELSEAFIQDSYSASNKYNDLFDYEEGYVLCSCVECDDLLIRNASGTFTTMNAKDINFWAH